MNRPAYLDLAESGELEKRARQAIEALGCCRLCARRCGADRLAGELGFCETGRRAWISSAAPHYGEERPLVGSGGSGTIFMTSCNLRCVFCQNEDISYFKSGRKVDADTLAEAMISLQQRGCHNINFVTPSHQIPQITEALVPAVEAGLNVPLVFNTGGYDSPEGLALCDGVFDIYMPDIKTLTPATAADWFDAPDYPEAVKAAVIQMHRQVGDLDIDARGIARRGLLVRHLVMPHGLADTPEVCRFLADRISADTYVNIMDQYRPCHHAGRHPKLRRGITRDEYEAALQAAGDAGLRRLDNRERSFIRILF